jgi:hypothetical protein
MGDCQLEHTCYNDRQMKANSDQEQPKTRRKTNETAANSTSLDEAEDAPLANQERRLLPQDIPLWFISFARHVLRCCGQPGVYHITLVVPSADDQPREIRITEQRILRLALCDNAKRPRLK